MNDFCLHKACLSAISISTIYWSLTESKRERECVTTQMNIKERNININVHKISNKQFDNHVSTYARLGFTLIQTSMPDKVLEISFFFIDWDERGRLILTESILLLFLFFFFVFLYRIPIHISFSTSLLLYHSFCHRPHRHATQLHTHT